MNKRDIFSEVVEGFEALASERKGKLTLRHVQEETKPVPVLESPEVLAVHQKLELSRQTLCP